MNTRSSVVSAFTKTLSELKGKDGISELNFINKWQANLAGFPDVTQFGWYCPPPKGMAMLSGERVSFSSLRDSTYWTSDKVIDWKNDLLYFYCSSINAETFELGDFAMTLYFGSDEKIKNHFQNCYEATKEITENLVNIDNSKDLFFKAEEIITSHSLTNNILSINDKTKTNIGHSIPKISYAEKMETNQPLPEDLIEKISKARNFINSQDEWNFADNPDFTIEPQLVSIEDSSMPKISFHHMIHKEKDSVSVSNDIYDILIEQNQLS